MVYPDLLQIRKLALLGCPDTTDSLDTRFDAYDYIYRFLILYEVLF